MSLQPVDLYSADISTDGNWPKRGGGSRFATCSPSANLKLEFSFKGTYAEAQGQLNIKPGKRPGPNSNIFSVDGFIKQFSVQPTPYTNGTFKLSSSNPLSQGQQHTLSISCTADLNEIQLDSINYIPADTGSNTGLSGGAIAGIVVGVVCSVVLLVGGLVFWLRKKRKSQAPVEEEHVAVPFQPPLDIIEGSDVPPPMTSHQKGSVTQVQPTFEPSPPPYPGPSE